MKLSSTPDDQNYWRKFFRIVPEVWIDGVQLHSVLEADDVEGYAIQPKFDDRFHIVHKDGEIVTVRREGKVTFVNGQPLASAEAGR